MGKKDGVKIKTIIVGDLHNEFGFLNTLINRKKPDLVICCGDFGYWPNIKNVHQLSEIKLHDCKLLWCDGNHEDHWSLENRTSNELAPGVFYMPRGSTYKLNDGRNILFMGGAHSIDKDSRILGLDWFPEETISQKDMMNLPNINIDIFITHTCPSELVLELSKYYYGKNLESSNVALSNLWNIYRPELWYFGHWHKFKNGLLHNKTKWTALSAPRWFTDRWWTWLPEK